MIHTTQVGTLTTFYHNMSVTKNRRPSSGRVKTRQRIIEKDGVTCRTLLHYMAMNDVDDILLPLIEAGFDVNAQDSDYRTPLHLAIIGNHAATTTSLVEKAGADVHARDLSNLLPFHYALSIDVDNIVENEDKKNPKTRSCVCSRGVLLWTRLETRAPANCSRR